MGRWGDWWRRPYCWIAGHRRKFGTYPVRLICVRCGSCPPGPVPKGGAE